MTKREFIIQYILNRARGHAGGLFAAVAMTEALKAWEIIQKEAPKENHDA